MKKCSKCGSKKELKEFYKNKTKKDGLQYECKTCANDITRKYMRSKVGVISIIYSNQKVTSIRRGHLPPNYTRLELLEFALKSFEFHTLFDNWVKSGYKRMLKPSFDRADDYKGYSFGNFNKWMTWQENKDKGSYDCKNGINNKNSKAVLQYTLDGEFVREYYSIAAAERQTSIDHGNISRCCLRNRKSAGGHKWEFKFKLEIVRLN